METHNPTSELLPDYNIFVKPDLYNLTNKQYTEQTDLAEFIQWGRRNPVLFAEEIFGVEFLDYQKYIFMSTWVSEQAVWCMSRNGGKSILGAIYMMTRAMLVPNCAIYIAANVGAQSIDTFLKIEKLTKNAIPSFKSLTDIFGSEIVKSQAKSDGFVRDPSSYHFRLYNGSSVNTLNGNIGNLRGKRANLLFYDEAMNSQDELFTVTEPFATQNTKFALGTDYDENDMLSEPAPFPNQLIYASSAGRTDGYFFKKYRECSIRMDAGDSRYFCADVNGDVVMHATKRGKELPEPLLTQDKIDSAMRKDKEGAMREYMNIFTTEGSDQQIIKRASIIRNSKPYLPEMFNIDDKSKYVIAWDPARRTDNSTVSIARFWEDPKVGWKMRLVNCVVLVDRLTKKKYMMSSPNQVKEVKQILIDYNGKGVADYENLLGFLIDSGSGGAGVNLTDYLCEDFTVDKDKHRGLIDPEYNEGDDKKYPNAVGDKLHLISPAKLRSQMFEEAIQMVSQNVVEFPDEYTQRGYVDLIYEVDKEGSQKQRYSYPDEKEEIQLRKEGKTIESVRKKLAPEEEGALVQIDLMKNEIVNMYRFKVSSGADRFELAPDKISSMHDDRNYTFILLCHFLSQLRREHITSKKREVPADLVQTYLPMKRATRSKML